MLGVQSIVIAAGCKGKNVGFFPRSLNRFMTSPLIGKNTIFCNTLYLLVYLVCVCLKYSKAKRIYVWKREAKNRTEFKHFLGGLDEKCIVQFQFKWIFGECGNYILTDDTKEKNKWSVDLNTLGN